MPHHILVIDAQQPGPMAGLRRWIDGTPGLEVWGHVSTSQDAQKALEVAQPDLVVTDAPTCTSERAAWMAPIQSAHPSLPILAVSHPVETNHVERALRAGAHGYVSRSASPDALLAAVRSILVGHVVFPESARETLFPDAPRPQLNGSTDALSGRQLEVLQLIGNGLTTTEIAERLGISPKTVETHRVHIKRRLNLETANALIRWATLWVESEPS